MVYLAAERSRTSHRYCLHVSHSNIETDLSNHKPFQKPFFDELVPFFEQIIWICPDLNLVGLSHVTFDGSKIKANASPKKSQTQQLGLKEGDPFIIVRFVSWQASHDVGHHGILDKSGLVKKLEEYGRVLITSEGSLPNELKSYRINASPEKIHDLLYYALLYFGDSPTMTTESALLGTPGICVSSWACNCGNFKDLSSKYDLLFCYNNEGIALNKAIELLRTNNIKDDWKTKREKMLKDKIDVTMFMVTFIEEYFL